MKHFMKSISTKVMLIMLLLILPFNVLAIMLSNAAKESMIEQAGVSVRSVMENYITDIQSKMETTEYLLWSLKHQEKDGLTVVKQEAGDAYELAKINLYYKLKYAKGMANGMDGYLFYMEKLDDILAIDTSYQNRLAGEEFARNEIKKGHQSGWHLNQIGDKQVLCLLIELDEVVYGGWLYLDPILEQIASDIQYQKDYFSFQEEEDMGEEGEDVIITSYSKKGDFYLTGHLNQQEILGGLSKAYTAMQRGAFIALLLVPILYLTINHLLLSPLRTVNLAQKELESGNLDYRIEKRASSIEYQHSFQSFNHMAGHIKDLKIQNYETELDRQHMELSNLQLQIRPHFLLNTFNLMYTLAERKEAAAIQKITIYLSDYFRYLFRSGNELELYSKEQHLIEGYMEMAAVRYPGSIEIEYSYDPEILFVRIPPLLIHNFVENIVKHVAKQGLRTHISIVGQYENQQVTFMIMDDGPGISQEILRELDESMRTKRSDGMHLGFYNSLRRVKCFYGEDADILISSETGEGTCVTISFPYDLEVSDEAFNCE